MAALAKLIRGHPEVSINCFQLSVQLWRPYNVESDEERNPELFRWKLSYMQARRPHPRLTCFPNWGLKLSEKWMHIYIYITTGLIYWVTLWQLVGEWQLVEVRSEEEERRRSGYHIKNKTLHVNVEKRNYIRLGYIRY